MVEKAYLRRVVTMLGGSPRLKEELCVPLLKSSWEGPGKPLREHCPVSSGVWGLGD